LNSDARPNTNSWSHVRATEYMLYKAENALSSDNRKKLCTVLEAVDFNVAF